MNIVDYKLGEYYYCLFETKRIFPDDPENSEFSWSITRGKVESKGIQLIDDEPVPYVEVAGGQRIRITHVFKTVEECIVNMTRGALDSMQLDKSPEVLPPAE